MKLTGEEHVRLLLAMIPYYEERQYLGNYHDNDDLNDIKYAIETADLTVRQRQVIELVFIKDMTQADVGRMLGIGQQRVSTHEIKAIKKITEAYERETRE